MAKTTTSTKSTAKKTAAAKSAAVKKAATKKTAQKKTEQKTEKAKSQASGKSSKTTAKKDSSAKQKTVAKKSSAEKKPTAKSTSKAKPEVKKTAEKPAKKSVAKKSAPVKSDAKAKDVSQKQAAAKPVKFRVNQKLVYPSQGVGKVLEIYEKKFQDQKLMYYKIYIEASDMTAHVPVNNIESLGIRPIVAASEAEKAIKMLAEDFEPITSDWKQRYQTNLDLLKSGKVEDIATIVRCLYNRSKVKELPVQERKLYDSARKLLEDEISLALGKSTKEIESLIHEKLESTNSVPKVKHIINLDDDDDDNLMDDMRDDVTSGDDDAFDDDAFDE